jgi:hypothetical protein
MKVAASLNMSSLLQHLQLFELKMLVMEGSISED